MKLLGFGQAVCEGTVSGKAVFNNDEAITLSREGEDIILVTEYTTPEDAIALTLVKGVITRVGGLMSHASITCREFNIPCIINVNIDKIKEGDNILLDSLTGNVYLKK